MAAVGPDARLLGAELVEHHEPIVLVGVPEAKVKALIAGYSGLDCAAEAAEGGSARDLELISGATVTVMIIDNSIVRSGLRVARALGSGGLRRWQPGGPRFDIDPDAEAPGDWESLVGDGSVRRLSLDVGQVNRAFEGTGNPRAADRREPGDEAENFIDLYAALVSVPGSGGACSNPGEFAALQEWLAPGEHAILVAGRGRYSFKGSGYVRGGLFDRIQLIQGDVSVRFRDRGPPARSGRSPRPGHQASLRPISSGSPPNPASSGGALAAATAGAARGGQIEKLFTTFDFAYQPPERFLRPMPVAAAPAPVPPNLRADAGEAEAKAALWQRIWREKRLEIFGLLAMLGTLTGAFFFQTYVTRSERFTYWFRIAFLTVTLVFLGWYANAQLSVVNLMALASSLATGFSWDAFLLEPLTFILWCSVAAALIFWGAGPTAAGSARSGRCRSCSTVLPRRCASRSGGALVAARAPLGGEIHPLPRALWRVARLDRPRGAAGRGGAVQDCDRAEVQPSLAVRALCRPTAFCGYSSSDSTAATSARSARRSPSRVGCACSTG